MKTSTVLFLAAAVLEPVIAVDWGKMYENSQFGGANTVFRSDGNGDCVSFTNENFAWNDKVSSLIMFPSNARCTFYVDAGCSGAGQDFISIDSNLPYPTVNYNDAFSSFRCSK